MQGEGLDGPLLSLLLLPLLLLPPWDGAGEEVLLKAGVRSVELPLQAVAEAKSHPVVLETPPVRVGVFNESHPLAQ